MATITIPKILANFETTLASKITSAASSLTIDRSTDGDGTTLSGLYSVTFDEGTSLEEHMYVTFAGAAGTVSRRGLSKVDAWTEVSGNKFEHDRGASVKVTNVSQILLQRLLNGDDTFNSVAWTGVASIAGLSTPTAGETTKAANVAYVNAVSVAGASDATTSTKGIVELATQAEYDARTATGGSGASLVATPALVRSVLVHDYAADAGGTDAYAITLTPAPTAYTTGARFTFKANTANTGAATLNVNSLGAKTIVKNKDTALADSDIKSGQVVEVVYDGTNMQLVSPTNMDEAQTFFDATTITGAQATTLSAGTSSVADSLHTHELPELLNYEMGVNRFIAIPIKIEANGTDGFSINGDTGGSTTLTWANARFVTDAAAGDMWGMETTASSSFGGGAIDWDNSFDLSWAANFSVGTIDAVMGMGIALIDTTGFTIITNHTSTSRHAAFLIDDGAVWASNGNGTTQTVTDISSGITLTANNTFRISYTSSSIRFYVNGVLKATHTTNIPTTGTDYGLAYGLGTTTATADSMYLSRTLWYFAKQT